MQIKVCHILSGDVWGGAEAVTFNLIESLNRYQNINVSVILLNRSELWQKLKAASIPVVVIDERRYNSWQIAQSLIRMLKFKKYDIIHTHGYKINLIISCIAKIIGGPKLVRTEHGIAGKGGNKLKSQWIGAVDKLSAVSCYDKIITVSEQIKKERYNKFGSSKTVVIHNGINVSEILKELETGKSIREELQLSSDKKLVGIVGRMVPVKGMDIFLEIAQRIAGLDDYVSFVVIGDGPLRKELEAKASLLGIGDRVKFIGFKKIIFHYLAALDLLTITSRHEGIPLALLEALSCKIPVVSFDVGGIKEVIESDESGMLIPFGDRQAFAQEILKLLNDKMAYKKLQDGGLKRVKTKFNTEQMVAKNVNIYQSLYR